MEKVFQGPRKGQWLKPNSRKNRCFLNLKQGYVIAEREQTDDALTPASEPEENQRETHEESLPIENCAVEQSAEEGCDDLLSQTISSDTHENPRNLPTAQRERMNNLPPEFLSGRRIVDLRYMAEQMVCYYCDNLLHLLDNEGEERRYGLASEIPLKCTRCSVINFVFTSRDSNTKELERDRRSRVFDSNTKLAIAMIDSGLGASHVNKVLTTLNIPAIGFSSIKRHEELVGDALFKQSEDCMAQAIIKEMNLTWVNTERSLSAGIISSEEFNDFCRFSEEWFSQEDNEEESSADFGDNSRSDNVEEENKIEKPLYTQEQENEKQHKASIPQYVMAYTQDREHRGLPCPIGASMDAAWMTRGNGKFTNSKTGHAELIGVYAGEVIASGRRHRHCTLCKTKSPEDHECHMNWTGSSKAMEADIITTLVINLKGARVTVLVGDEDSATMAKIRELVPWQVSKVTDVVHAKKNFGGALFAARHKLLTPKIIEYLKDCLSYALHQNQDRPDDVKAAIMNIPLHVFNDHTKCGDWCRFKREPETYKHKRLPEIWAGSEDSKQSLQRVITSICEKFAAKSKSLAPCLSSNVNESFNFVVTTFAPKNRHYGGTQSIDRRIDGAVLQKNKGLEYIIEVNKELKLSPGDFTKKHRAALGKDRKRRSVKSKLPEQKIKRRKIFKMSLNEQLRKESAEGVQYKSGMGFLSTSGDIEVESTSNFTEIVQREENFNVDEHQMEENIIVEQVEPVVNNEVHLEQQSNNESCRKKKTSVRRPMAYGTAPAKRISLHCDFQVVVFDTETTGLSDMAEIVQLAAKSSSAKFNKFCCPSVRFCSSAEKVNNFTSRGDKLYQGGQSVPTLPKKIMLEEFLIFLQSHSKPILLLAHNAKFDVGFLWREMLAQALHNQFLNIFVGSCDTIKFFKSKLPKMPSYNLKAVCQTILGPHFTFNEHDAAGDVDALWECLEQLGFDNEEGVKFSTSSQAYFENLEELSKKKAFVRKFAERTSKKISDATVMSLVKNNLLFEDLMKLSKDQPEFTKVVSPCFVQRAKKRCEEIYLIFNSFK